MHILINQFFLCLTHLKEPVHQPAWLYVGGTVCMDPCMVALEYHDYMYVFLYTYVCMYIHRKTNTGSVLCAVSALRICRCGLLFLLLTARLSTKTDWHSCTTAEYSTSAERESGRDRERERRKDGKRAYKAILRAPKNSCRENESCSIRNYRKSTRVIWKNVLKPSGGLKKTA